MSLGSIMFGYLIPKIFKQVDTKKDSEDGNPGTAKLLSRWHAMPEFVHFY